MLLIAKSRDLWCEHFSHLNLKTEDALCGAHIHLFLPALLFSSLLSSLLSSPPINTNLNDDNLYSYPLDSHPLAIQAFIAFNIESVNSSISPHCRLGKLAFTSHHRLIVHNPRQVTFLDRYGFDPSYRPFFGSWGCANTSEDHLGVSKVEASPTGWGIINSPPSRNEDPTRWASSNWLITNGWPADEPSSIRLSPVKRQSPFR